MLLNMLENIFTAYVFFLCVSVYTSHPSLYSPQRPASTHTVNICWMKQKWNWSSIIPGLERNLNIMYVNSLPSASIFPYSFREIISVWITLVIEDSLPLKISIFKKF